jgi:hypothetical protein
MWSFGDCSVYGSCPWWCREYWHGIPSLLRPYTGDFHVFWCNSDPTTPGAVSGRRTSYEYRWVIAWNSANWTVKDNQFAYPSRQVVYHERFDWHYGQFGLYQRATEVRGRPIHTAVYKDGHGIANWMQPPRTGTWFYDAHWFFYGTGGDIRSGHD